MRERCQQGSSKQDKKANERIESDKQVRKKKQMKGDKTKEREKYVSNEEQASDTKKQQNKQASERLQNERARARRQRGDGRAKRLMRPKEETKKTGDGVLTFSAVLKMPVIFLSLSKCSREDLRTEGGASRDGSSEGGGFH